MSSRESPFSFGGGSSVISPASIPVADLLFSTNNRLAGRVTAGAGGGEEIGVAGALAFSGFNVIVANNGISNALLRQSSALSVIGNATNGTANVADIAAASNDTILRRTGSTLNFGGITAGMLSANLIPLADLVNATQKAMIFATAAGAWAERAISADVETMLGYANNAAILSGIGADAKYVAKAGDTMTGGLAIYFNGLCLDVKSDTPGTFPVKFGAYETSATGFQFGFQKARGSQASPAVIATNDVVGQFVTQGYDGSTFRTASIYRTIVVAATPSSTDMESRTVGFLNPAGSVTQTEVIRWQHAVGLSLYGANVVIDNNRHFRLRSYTVATLPSASTATGQVIYCTDLGGTTNGGFLVSNGTIWQREAMGYETHGDSDLTWAYLSNAHTVEFTTTLTADRTVTLGNTVAPRKGIAVRVTRSALGAFNLIIKDDAGTTLLTMTGATARSADFTYSGSHFRLSQDSTL